MKVAVIGLGTYGRSLATTLSQAGAEVIAVDANLDLVDDVRDDVASAVKLDATEERELRAQGIDEVDVLVACIGDDFEANQLVVILAKKLGIKRVLARTSSPVHARILKLIGADEVVLPEVQAAQVTARQILEPSLKNYFELIEGYSVAELKAPGEFHGKSLLELNLKQRFRVNLLVIRHPLPDDPGRHSINAVPLGTDIIQPGDILTVAGRDQDIRELAAKHGGG